MVEKTVSGVTVLMVVAPPQSETTSLLRTLTLLFVLVMTMISWATLLLQALGFLVLSSTLIEKRPVVPDKPKAFITVTAYSTLAAMNHILFGNKYLKMYKMQRDPKVYMVPIAPLQRPDEMQSNNSWMHNSSSYEDMMTEQGIPTMITWSYDGKEVAVEGSWDNWKTRKPLQRSGKDFIILKVLPSGVYQYRFVVDGQWRYSPDGPCTKDETGNTYNILDLQEYVPEDIESISGFEPPRSPDSSYNNLQLGYDDYAKEPPLVPPHLQMTLLNAPLHMEKPPLSSRPQHVIINHLYMQKGRSSDSVVALGSTHRFLSKYVTVVLYKSIHQ